MKYIFEDNISMTVSNLIIKLFGIDNCIFTNTNTQLLNEYAKNSDSIVFVDVSPDNPQTITIYNELMAYDSSRVYPYPCIEFCVIFMLFMYEYNITKELPNKMLRLLNGEKVYDQSSLEKFCKQELNNSYKKCLRNITVGTNSIFGKFYITDCECPVEYSKNCKGNITILEKAELLHFIMPDNWEYSELYRLYGILSKAVGLDNPIFSER